MLKTHVAARASSLNSPPASVRPAVFRQRARSHVCVLAAARIPGNDPSRSSVVVKSLRPGESPEIAQERRLKESTEILRKVHKVGSIEEWERELESADGKLVVIEISSDYHCQAPGDEFVQNHWKLDEIEEERRRMERCSGIKHTFMRVARECNSMRFVQHEVDEEPTEESEALMDHLNVDLLPTVQFWKDGIKVYEHRGAEQLDNKLGEGVLYYGDTAAGGVKATDYVVELKTKEDLEKFVASADDEKELLVVNIALLQAKPCVQVFPAVLALARNFEGYAKFARMHVDGAPDVMKELNIIEVPTFIFYRNGQEVGRHVGSDRGDLIGQILTVQGRAGIAAPPPQTLNAAPRPRRAVH